MTSPQGITPLPEQMPLFNAAYIATLRALSLRDQHDPIMGFVADTIIQLINAGETDSSKIAIRVLS